MIKNENSTNEDYKAKDKKKRFFYLIITKIRKYYQKKPNSSYDPPSEETKKKWKDLDIGVRTQIFLTIITTLILIVYIMAYGNQYIQTKEALKKADSANFYTRKAVDLSEKAFRHTIYSDSINEKLRQRDIIEKGENTKRELRAYISIKYYTPELSKTMDKDEIIKIEYKNIGKTLAKLTSYGQVGQGGNGVPNFDIYVFKNRIVNLNIIMYPGESFCRYIEIPISDLKIGTYSIWGEINYIDIFNAHHHVKFCAFYDSAANAFIDDVVNGCNDAD
jgi:hypothetical protein